ncbi:MAG: HD domain-containing protein [Gammaproteobacteria bacterium]|nr:HD domain-containing protein [Gammaproteobacteria bacterium]
MQKSIRLSIPAAALALAALVVAGFAGIGAYVDEERQRDLLQWEARLGLVADAKSDAASRLLDNQRREVVELAGNASLRFYLWQIEQARQSGPTAGDLGALGYLRNLVLASASRYGYLDAGGQLPANLSNPRTTGMAVLDVRLNTVVVTPGLTGVAATFADIGRRALEQPGRVHVALMPDEHDRAVIAAAIAVGSLPGTDAGDALGVVLGVRSAELELYPMLIRGPAFGEDNEALLLERRGDTVALLSPTRDGSAPLRRTLPVDRADLAEASAVKEPGRFVELDNYRGESVLQVTRSIRGLDWVLAQQVDAVQALSLGDERRRFLFTALTLLLLFLVAVALAAWRHGSSVRARAQAAELADRAYRLQRQTDLLHNITDNLDALTILVTRDQRVLFTNQAMAAAVGATIGSLIGGNLAAVVESAVKRELQSGIEASASRRATVHRLLSMAVRGVDRTFSASFIPVERIGGERQPTLIVLSDITEVQQSQQRQTDLLRRLVLTLVSAIDRHDPYSADHARRMTEVADALARELGFSDEERSTLNLAASLANIGKIMIPVEILTKTAPLSPEEQQLLKKHVELGLELLRGLEFEGPVTEIIAQKQERPDGRGYPQGLAGERITLAGQVLAVANGFVALVSPRAWRDGLTVRAAVAELQRMADAQFDRRVIAALVHVVENRRDWSQWEQGEART